MSDPFLVKLEDPPEIKPQAREAAYAWYGDVIEIMLDGYKAVATWLDADRNGVFTIDRQMGEYATVAAVSRERPHRWPTRWSLLKDDKGLTDKNLTAGDPVPKSIVLSTRLRLSLWSFTPPFAKKLISSDKVELDTDLLAMLYDASVDDLSLVWTITWDTREPSQDPYEPLPVKPPKWDPKFQVLGSNAEGHRQDYLEKLIEWLRLMGIQLVIGFEIVLDGSENSREKSRAQDFANWLGGATRSEIKDYAQAINDFFQKRHLHIGGVSFDFEFTGLEEKHRKNLGLLYQETSNAISALNGLVSYANAPFTQADGAHSVHFMRAQPFALAAGGPNLLARPMCYDANSSRSFKEVEQSIECALRSAQAQGGGLHPSQLQCGIWATKLGTAETERWCKELLYPNRVGLMVYTLPADRKHTIKCLADCAIWNKALNPNPADQYLESPGQPLQIPRPSLPLPDVFL